jgi:hypothetical protein
VQTLVGGFCRSASALAGRAFANNGATAHQLMAIFDWNTLATAEIYFSIGECFGRLRAATTQKEAAARRSKPPPPCQFKAFD